jgi:hypothetical protein
MSTLLKTGLAVAALASLLAACNDPVAAPEPANEGVAAEMPQTPDMGAASEAAAGASTTTAPTETVDPAPGSTTGQTGTSPAPAG